MQALRITHIGADTYLIGLHHPGAMLQVDALAQITAPERSLHVACMGPSAQHQGLPRYVQQCLGGQLNHDALSARGVITSFAKASAD